MTTTIKQVLGAALLPLVIGVAEGWAVPITDGRFDPAEGYTNGYEVSFDIQGGPQKHGDGQLWVYQDPATRDVSVALVQPTSLVDNTYGKNAIGWGAHGHRFGQLTGSDMAEFRFTNGTGQVVLDVRVDYLSQDRGASSGYASLGVTGGDGRVITGSASDVLAWGTSLDYNFNNQGDVLTKDSPVTDSHYTPNPQYPGWVFADEYELRVSGRLFANGFGGVTVPIVHDSPNKLGKNRVTTTIGPPIGPPSAVPEPASLLLVGSGLAGLRGWRWVRRHAHA